MRKTAGGDGSWWCWGGGEEGRVPGRKAVFVGGGKVGSPGKAGPAGAPRLNGAGAPRFNGIGE